VIKYRRFLVKFHGIVFSTLFFFKLNLHIHVYKVILSNSHCRRYRVFLKVRSLFKQGLQIAMTYTGKLLLLGKAKS